MKQRIGRHWTDRVDALRLKLFYSRSDDNAIFLAESAFLAGVRIEASDCDPRTRNPEAGVKIVCRDSSSFYHQVRRELRDHVLERQMDCHRHHRELRRP